MVEITPYVGVGELQFGRHCDEVCEPLGAEYRRIDSRYSPGCMLCTGKLGLHFNAGDRLTDAEGSLDAGLCCQGIALAGRPFNEVYKAPKALDPEIRADRDGAIAFRKGCRGDSEPD